MARKPAADKPVEEAWEDVMEASGELAGSVAIKRKVGGKEKYLGLATVDEMRDDPYETLRARYGGGSYVLQLKTDVGKFMAGTRTHFEIDGLELDPKEAARLEAEERRWDREGERGSGSEGREIFREMSDIRVLLATKPEPVQRESVAEIIAAVAPLLAPVLKALLEKKSDDGGGSMGRIEELTTLMELAKGMQGPTDGIGSLVKTMGEPIAKLLTAHVDAQPAAAGAQPNPSQEAGVARPAWYSFIAPIVPQAIRWAKGKKDVLFRADFIVDELTDEQLGPVHSTLTSPTFREEFYRHFPEASEHAAFFDALFARIVYGIWDEDDAAKAKQEAAADPVVEEEALELEPAPDAPDPEPDAPDPEPDAPEPEPVAEEPDPSQVDGAETRSLG